jgi:stage IV sporulation protein FB
MSLQTDKRLQFSGDFFLLTVWFAIVNGWELLGMILAAAVLHELGHLVVLWLLRAKILALRVGILGAVLETDCRRLTYGGELAAVLAGPVMNLLSACFLSRFAPEQETFIGIHLALGGFNLLPVRPLDGGRGLELLLTWLFGPFVGETAVRWVGAGTAFLLALLLGWLVKTTGGSLWLLPAMVGVLGTAGREAFGKR